MRLEVPVNKRRQSYWISFGIIVFLMDPGPHNLDEDFANMR